MDRFFAHPIKGGTAPDILPTTVFSVYFLFVHKLYRTTYVKAPINPIKTAIGVVNNKNTKPRSNMTSPNVSANPGLYFPVTVGRVFVLSINGSMSRSDVVV